MIRSAELCFAITGGVCVCDQLLRFLGGVIKFALNGTMCVAGGMSAEHHETQVNGDSL